MDVHVPVPVIKHITMAKLLRRSCITRDYSPGHGESQGLSELSFPGACLHCMAGGLLGRALQTLPRDILSQSGAVDRFPFQSVSDPVNLNALLQAEKSPG